MHVTGPAFPSTANVSLGHGGRVTVVTVWIAGAVVLAEVVVELDSGTAAIDLVTVLVVEVVDPHAAIEQATNTADAIVIRLIAPPSPLFSVGVLAIIKPDQSPMTTVVLLRSFKRLPAHE